MGNSESSENHKFDGCETLGYRILGVQPNSPASRAGLVSFFDFLVGANGQLLFGIDDGSGNEYFEDIDFPALLKGSVDKEIELLVWNIKNKTQRFLTLTPTTSWGGKGLIGVTIRMDDYATAEENLLRVLSVEKNSPAALAGLTPSTDYLLGTTMESFENEGVLADILEENEESVVEIYVYNTESDVVRVVTLVPSTKWGGRGLLGAEIGRGYLHRLPKGCTDTLGVSFERKVLVDDHDATSCGAVDLKLNETVKNESNVQEESSSTEESAGVDGTKHSEMAADEKKVEENVQLSTTDGGSQKEDEKIDKEVLEGVANSTLDETTTKETAGECTNETSESIAMSTTTNEKDEDSSLINAVEPSSEVLDELPPPPTPLSIGSDANAVDLR